MAQIQPINIDFSPLDQAFALRRQALGERADKQEAAQAEQSRANQEQVAFDRGMQILQLKGQQEKDILAQKGEQSTNLQELKGRQEVEQQDDPAAQFRASVPVINNILRQLGDQEDPELLKAFLSELQQFEQFEAFGDLDFSALKGKAPEAAKDEKQTYRGKSLSPFEWEEKANKEKTDKLSGDPQKELTFRIVALDDSIDFMELPKATRDHFVNLYDSGVLTVDRIIERIKSEETTQTKTPQTTQAETIDVGGRKLTKTQEKSPDGKYDVYIDENGTKVIVTD